VAHSPVISVICVTVAPGSGAARARRIRRVERQVRLAIRSGSWQSRL